MELWQEMLRQSVDSGKDLVERFDFKPELADQLNSLFHTRINPYYMSLIRHPGDPIWLQCIPDARELDDDGMMEDPLAEDSHSPVPSIVHRYPGPRALPDHEPVLDVLPLLHAQAEGGRLEQDQHEVHPGRDRLHREASARSATSSSPAATR